MNKFILLTIVLVFNIAAHAAIQTDTHTYIFSKGDNRILVIDRNTDQEQWVLVGTSVSDIEIHEGLGYIVDPYSKSVFVLDLKSNTLIKKIFLCGNPLSIAIHEGLGYVADMDSNLVHVIDLKSRRVPYTIPVPKVPVSIAIHEGLGYVVNRGTDSVSVIDLKSRNVIHTISVEMNPNDIAIHEGLGFVVNQDSNSVSVIDLKSSTVIHTIPVGGNPRKFNIHEGLGYVAEMDSNSVKVIDLKSLKTIGDFKNYSNGDIHFSDTHIYSRLSKLRPLYPTLNSLQRMKAEGSLVEFVKMNPKVFEVGKVKQRDYPKEENEFDQMPPYALAQNLFWDVETNKPLMDPVDILATLITMKYPQRLLQTEAGQWLRSRLHMAFFQVVWLGQNEKAQKMLRYFIQLDDPVMTKLTTSELVKPSTIPLGATNSTSK